MLKKTLAASLLLLASVVATSAPALAGDGYADEDALVLSDTTVAPGEDFEATVQVCEPGTDATFEIDGEAAGEAVADDEGQATATLTAPTEEGTHTVTGECTGLDGEALVLSSTLTVAAAGAGAPLPSTGSNNTISLTQIGVGAVVLGGLVLIASRRRSSQRDQEVVGA
jgi:LPXTG-motif cell wall-anchored protein